MHFGPSNVQIYFVKVTFALNPYICRYKFQFISPFSLLCQFIIVTCQSNKLHCGKDIKSFLLSSSLNTLLSRLRKNILKDESSLFDEKGSTSLHQRDLTRGRKVFTTISNNVYEWICNSGFYYSLVPYCREGI